MSQFSVNLSTIFTEVPFLERFQKAKESGFSHVECQFPYEETIEGIKTELERHHLSLVLINLPPGDWRNGDRGLAIDANRMNEFKDSVEKGIQYATSLEITTVHCMAGILLPEQDRLEARKVYIENLRYAGKRLAEYGLTVVIEPINQIDMPGYFLTDINEAAQIIKEVDLSNVKLQFDFYHIQRLQGNLLETFEQYQDLIQHVQIADLPGRHEPGTGEINYENILPYIENLGYTGFIGLEYIPKAKSEMSFVWLKDRRLL